jgi:two-component system, cell cycle sensor histidine kinase and response regulator CckA
MSLSLRRAPEASAARSECARGDALFALNAEALELVSESVITVDSSGRICSVNAAAASLTMWDRRTAIGCLASDILHLIDEATSQRIDLPDLRQIAQPEPARSNGSALLVCRDTTVIPVDFSIRIIPGDSGRGIGAVVTLTDTRDRRRSDEVLRQTRVQLLHASKLEAVAMMTTKVSHDFANVLTVIVGETENALANARVENQATEALRQVFDAARRGADLARSLLAFARHESIDPQVVNLREVIASCEPLVRRLAGADVCVRMRLSDTTPDVCIVPGQIQMVIMNLTANARDAMPDGGRLTIATSEQWFDATSRNRPASAPPGRYGVVTVSDTGQGIPAEALGRIFEPFFTTKDRSHGTGLGLSIVDEAVGRAGGHIQLDSRPGRGTSIAVYLPAALI